MPRSRESEGLQRQSPRGSSLHLRTSSSDSNSTRHRSTNDSPKLGDRQSPRGAQSNPNLSQKKLGTRIADLESQLGQAQVELKNLKGQLANAEQAKKEAQELLEKKTRKPKARDLVQVEDKHFPEKKEDKKPCEIADENQRETDVFEVPMEDPKVEIIDPEVDKTKPTSEANESLPELKRPSFDDMALKDEEINLLKAKLEEKDKELEASRLENENLKAKLNEAALEKTSSEAKQEETNSKLAQLVSELAEKKASETELLKKLDEIEVAKSGLETEMKKMKIQTEQWRKAADAAAAVLAGDVEMNHGRRVSERCGSMDKHISNMFEPYVGSPGFGDDSDDGIGGGKRKSSGMRMFGDLWRKKGQK